MATDSLNYVRIMYDYGYWLTFLYVYIMYDYGCW